ncbi:MAG TPA: phosphodiesterase, partial [Clostridiaceae bacterium]|nr:phosphodiesterase [Clostridiaceae bacterium]
MKIGIISDLHGYPEQFKKAINILKGSDMILCAGDILYHGPRNPILEGYRSEEHTSELQS